MLRVAEHWCGTDTGLQRRANEDSLLVRSPLFVVADGMGGAQAGEVASRLAVETFRGGLSDPAHAEQSLQAQVTEANSRIHDLSHEDAEHAGMGTTITAAYVGEQDISVAHVGDSRAYCLREGELLRLTDDHSLVDELIRQGRLTPEEAEEHPQRSVITRALGPEADVEVDLRNFRGRPDDLYLLCSDGLTTMVNESELARLLGGHRGLAQIGESLITAANSAGGKDNITVVLFRLEEVLSETERAADGHTTITQVPLTGGAAATATAQATTAAPVAARQPRRPHPPTSSLSRRLKWWRRTRGALVAIVILGLLAAGAYLALQSVYFIGTNQRGLVTIFEGLPYELPAKIKLYTSKYVSGVSAITLPAQHRHALLDHSLRSESDAAELMRQIELGQLNEK